MTPERQAAERRTVEVLVGGRVEELRLVYNRTDLVFRDNGVFELEDNLDDSGPEPDYILGEQVDEIDNDRQVDNDRQASGGVKKDDVPDRNGPVTDPGRYSM